MNFCLTEILPIVSLEPDISSKISTVSHFGSIIWCSKCSFNTWSFNLDTFLKYSLHKSHCWTNTSLLILSSTLRNDSRKDEEDSEAKKNYKLTNLKWLNGWYCPYSLYGSIPRTDEHDKISLVNIEICKSQQQWSTRYALKTIWNEMK